MQFFIPVYIVLWVENDEDNNKLNTEFWINFDKK